MHELLVADYLDFHENSIGIARAFILADRKWLSATRRTLVDYAEFSWWMLFKEIPEHKLSLGFAVRFNLIVDCHVDGLIEKPRKFFRASSLNGLFDLVNYIALTLSRRKRRNKQ
jgi:hypothetical protein